MSLQIFNAAGTVSLSLDGINAELLGSGSVANPNGFESTVNVPSLVPPSEVPLLFFRMRNNGHFGVIYYRESDANSYIVMVPAGAIVDYRVYRYISTPPTQSPAGGFGIELYNPQGLLVLGRNNKPFDGGTFVSFNIPTQNPTPSTPITVTTGNAIVRNAADGGNPFWLANLVAVNRFDGGGIVGTAVKFTNNSGDYVITKEYANTSGGGRVENFLHNPSFTLFIR